MDGDKSPLTMIELELLVLSDACIEDERRRKLH
jgi:hypothetical protein